MASVQTVFGVEGGRGLRISYTCTEAVVGGQVVEARTTGNTPELVGVAAAGSLVVVGVALDDVPAAAGYIGQLKVGDGHELSVVRMAVVEVTFAAAATHRQKLATAANGQVTPVTVATQDPRTIVGEAFSSLDRTSSAIAAGARGLAYIY